MHNYLDQPTQPLRLIARDQRKGKRWGRRAVVCLLFIAIIILLIFGVEAALRSDGVASSVFIVLATVLGLLIALISIGYFHDLIDLLDTPLYNLSSGISNFFKKKLQLFYNIVSALAIIILVCIYIFPIQAYTTGQVLCLNAHWPFQFVCGNGIGIMSLAVNGDMVHIGVSDGHDSILFDSSSQNAAEQDVEQKIFQENRSISSRSHMTLVVATTLSRTPDDMTQSATEGLEDLRGAYLRQKAYNDDSSHPIKLRLLIANVGTRLTVATTVPLVVRQLLRLAQMDSTLRGVIGLPSSGGTIQALDTRDNPPLFFQNTSLPFISPSATSDKLSHRSLFYRVVTDDQQQSNDLAAFVETQVSLQGSFSQNHPFRVALFEDSDDPYSASLGYDFSSAVQNNYQDIKVFTEPYNIGQASSFASSVKEALPTCNGANALFFAGYADDLNTLIQTLLGQEHTLGCSNIPIIGGDGLYNIYGYVNTASADVFSTVYSTPLESGDPFISTYTSTFGENPPTLPGPGTDVPTHSRLAPHSILSYEAVSAFLATLDKALLEKPGLPSQSDFNDKLATVSFNQISNDSMSFRGSTTEPQSDPSNEPIYILCENASNVAKIAAEFDAGGHPEQPPASSSAWQC